MDSLVRFFTKCLIRPSTCSFIISIGIVFSVVRHVGRWQDVECFAGLSPESLFRLERSLRYPGVWPPGDAWKWPRGLETQSSLPPVLLTQMTIDHTWARRVGIARPDHRRPREPYAWCISQQSVRRYPFETPRGSRYCSSRERLNAVAHCRALQTAPQRSGRASPLGYQSRMLDPRNRWSSCPVFFPIVVRSMILNHPGPSLLSLPLLRSCTCY